VSYRDVTSQVEFGLIRTLLLLAALVGCRRPRFGAEHDALFTAAEVFPSVLRRFDAATTERTTKLRIFCPKRR